ncbi:AraC family transcriptional regulator [Nocardia puris]|uniref:AraC family transcriptional regulator n=1 Tax=Nocardia puris TaxID=208602 RepID=A0A366E4P6_9NOCA|nr:AraC family transcriptional regulator [Nocardia puris]
MWYESTGDRGRVFEWDLPGSGSGVLMLARERGVAAAPGPPSADWELGAVRVLVRRFGGEPGLGLEAGRRCAVRVGGPWGLAALSSSTLRQVIDLAVRYADPGSGLGRLTFREDEREAALVFDDLSVPGDLRPFLAERAFAEIQGIGARLFAAGLPVRRVTFRHGMPAHTRRHRAVFGVEPHFRAAEDALVFAAASLDRRLPRPTKGARDSAARLCRDLLDDRSILTGVAAEVREVLIRDPGVIPDLTEVAAALYMSPRTLSRKLSMEGTTFRVLVDEVRQALSEQLLGHTRMTTEQVASRLGYAESASFIRAFRRWNGCPPRDFRSRAGVRA